jgi:sugar phosphate permease
MTLAIVDIGASAGVALASLVIPLVVAAYNWRMGWKGLGTLALIIAGLNYLLVRDSRIEETKLHDREFREPLNEAASRISGKILGDGKFLLIGTSYLLIGFSILVPLTFISTYAAQELMFPYEVATRVITTIAVASVAGKLVLGHLSDSMGRIKIIIICQILIAMGNLGIVYFPKLLTINLSMAIFGFGHGAIWPLYALCAPDYFSKSSAGFIVGFWTLFLGIGFILSPVISGWIVDTTGKFMWSFILATVTAIMSMFLMLLVGKKISCGNPIAVVPVGPVR